MATILVVDDELGSRSVVAEILGDEGHKVMAAENAAQARAYYERNRPDLVLLDIWMPDVDGITLLKEWAAGGQLTMPVIMLSAHGSIDTAVQATKFGATAFLEKPIDLQKLLRAVEESLAQSAALRAPVAAVAPSAAVVTVRSTAAGRGTPDVAPVRSSLQPEQGFDLDRPLREARDEFERSYFEYHLEQENGSITRVAEKTGIERTHLYRKLKQLGLDSWRSRRTQQVVSAPTTGGVIRSLPVRGGESFVSVEGSLPDDVGPRFVTLE